MSTFSRLKNLAKGVVLTHTADDEPDLDVEAELLGPPRAHRRAGVRAAAPPPQQTPEAEEAPQPVQLDARGNVKRTL